VFRVVHKGYFYLLLLRWSFDERIK
jgi:hypothetical protein